MTCENSRKCYKFATEILTLTRNYFQTLDVDYSFKNNNEVNVISLIIGTSDEHITVMENLRQVPQCSAILVTTPQEVAIEDVRKEITFCRKTGIPIMGLIENMSGYV